ncbi:hypothetical protein FOL47_008027, partial [Perkinsus chesapeaki]
MSSESGLSSDTSAAAAEDAFGWPIWQGARSFDGHGECSLVAYDTARTETGEIIPIGDGETAVDLQKFRIGLTVVETDKKIWVEYSYEEFERLFVDEHDLYGEPADSQKRFDWLLGRLALVKDPVEGLVLIVSEETAIAASIGSDEEEEEALRVTRNVDKSQLRIQQLEKQAKRSKLEAKRRAKIEQIEKKRCNHEAEVALKIKEDARRRTEQLIQRAAEEKRRRDERVKALKQEEARVKLEQKKLNKLRDDNITRREIRSLLDLIEVFARSGPQFAARKRDQSSSDEVFWEAGKIFPCEVFRNFEHPDFGTEKRSRTVRESSRRLTHVGPHHRMGILQEDMLNAMDSLCSTAAPSINGPLHSVLSSSEVTSDWIEDMDHFIRVGDMGRAYRTYRLGLDNEVSLGLFPGNHDVSSLEQVLSSFMISVKTEGHHRRASIIVEDLCEMNLRQLAVKLSVLLLKAL